MLAFSCSGMSRTIQTSLSVHGDNSEHGGSRRLELGLKKIGGAEKACDTAKIRNHIHLQGVRDMLAKRHLLYEAYKAIKCSGGIRLANAYSRFANIITFHRV